MYYEYKLYYKYELKELVVLEEASPNTHNILWVYPARVAYRVYVIVSTVLRVYPAWL